MGCSSQGISLWLWYVSICLLAPSSNSLFMVSISSLTNSYFCRSTWSSYWSESFTNISITACCWSISFALNPRISSRLGSSFSFLQSCYFYLNIGFLLIYLIIFCYDLRFLPNKILCLSVQCEKRVTTTNKDLKQLTYFDHTY